MAPPGRPIATFTGATNKADIVAAAKKAGSGCDPKSGCCPPKKPAGAELRGALEKTPGVELAFLYGSYASGEAHATSDLDLMIVGNASDRGLAPAVATDHRRRSCVPDTRGRCV